MIKNAFYFILKALSALKIFEIFFLNFLFIQKKRLDQRHKVNFQEKRLDQRHKVNFKVMPDLDQQTIAIRIPVCTGPKLYVHKTFKGRLGRLHNVLCTFNLRPVSAGILPNISSSKGNQTMKFDQLIAYNMKNIFLERSYIKCGGETIP